MGLASARPIDVQTLSLVTYSCYCTYVSTHTVLIRKVSVATINFSLAWVRLLIEGGFY